MKTIEFFTLSSVTILAIVALGQVSLLQTIITNSGYDPVQVWSGIGTVMLILYSFIYVLSYK